MDLTLSDFTAQLASAQPAPGGGGAAALTGALAASLTAMAANVTAANPRYAERSDTLRSLIDACETQRTTLLALIEADAAGFLPLQKAYAIPKADPDRAAKLAAARADGLSRAAGDAGALRTDRAAADRRARDGKSPPALGRRLCRRFVPRRGGGCGHERVRQHRSAHAG